MRRRFCVTGCKRGVGRKEGRMDGWKEEEGGRREKDGMEGDGMDFIDSLPSCSGWRDGSDSFLGDDKSYIGGSHDGHTHNSIKRITRTSLSFLSAHQNQVVFLDGVGIKLLLLLPKIK
jgi:hypothetical protein